jgi:hypothetical protein
MAVIKSLSADASCHLPPMLLAMLLAMLLPMLLSMGSRQLFIAMQKRYDPSAWNDRLMTYF